MSNTNAQLKMTRRVRLWSLFLFGAWAAFLFAGSWYPFRLNARSWEDAWRSWRSISIGSDHATTDVALNLLVGVPLGFLGYLAIFGDRRRGPLSWLVSAVVLGVCAGISTMVEMGQHRISHRVASSIDTLAQTVGAGGGILLAAFAGSWLVYRLTLVLGSQAIRDRRRYDAALDLYVAGYAGWMLMPFMPALSPSELAGKWRSGAIQLSPMANWLNDPWTAGYTALVCLVTAFPVGLWVSRQRIWKLHRQPLLLRAVFAAGLVAGLECMQVFIETRTFAVDDVLWSMIGAMLGLMLAEADHRQPSQITRNPSFWSIIVVLNLSIYLIAAWAPFDVVNSFAEFVGKLRATIAEPAGWKEIGGNDYVLGTNLLRTGLWSLVLGAIVASWSLLKMPRMPAAAWGLAAALASFVAVLAEVGQFAIQSSNPSLLAVFMRTSGALLGVTLVSRLFR